MELTVFGRRGFPDVDDGEPGAEHVTDVGVTVRNDRLDIVAPASLVRPAEEVDVVPVIG